MQVRVTSHSVVLDDPDDCTTLTLLRTSATGPSSASLLASSTAGLLDDHGALLSVSWIRSESSGRIGIGWNHRFAHLLLQVAAQGRLTDNGEFIRTPITEPQTGGQAHPAHADRTPA